MKSRSTSPQPETYPAEEIHADAHRENQKHADSGDTQPRQEEASGWLIMRGVKWAYWLYKQKNALLPTGTRRRWLAVLAVGLAISAALTIGMAELLKRLEATGALRHETVWLHQFVQASPLSFSSAIYLGVPTDTIFLVVVIVSATLFTLWRGSMIYALTILASLVLPDLVVAVSWLSWSRPRPDLIHGGIAAPGLGSFPSGHVLQAVVIYGFLAFLWMEATRNKAEKVVAALLALFVVALVSAARLELGVHWPSDVLAAFPVGLILLTTLIVALRRACAYVKRHDTPGAPG